MSLEEPNADASATVVIRPTADGRTFHKPREGSLSPACNGSWEGQAMPKRGAESKGYSPCQRPECFGEVES